MKAEDIAATMLPRTLPMSFDGPMLSLELEHVTSLNVWKAKVPPKASLTTTVILTMFTKGINPDALRFCTKDQRALRDIPLVEAFTRSPEVLCSIWQHPLVLLRTLSAQSVCPASSCDAAVSPTLPFSVEDLPRQLVIEPVPPVQPPPGRFHALLQFLDFNSKWHPEQARTKQRVSLLWEDPPGVLTIELDSTVPAADLQEQLATHFGSDMYTVYQSPFSIPRIALGPLFTVRLCDHPNDALVVFQKLQTEVWVRACVVPKQLARDTSIVTATGTYIISNHNNRPCTTDTLHTANGDLFLIEPAPSVHAGGHHRWTRRPETLGRGAHFTDRIGFAINTHGWVASDEMHSAMMHLTRNFPEDIAEFNLLRWNSEENEFDDELYGEPRFATSGRTINAVLVDNHWAAIEVNRIGHHTQLHVFGLGPLLADRAIHIMCRSLEIAPHRAQQHVHAGMPPEHLCGWFLLFRYYRLCRIHDILPSTMDLFNSLPAFRRAEIREAWEAGQEDWRRAGASDELLNFATTLRTNFLTRLAATATQTSSVVPVPLFVQFQALPPEEPTEATVPLPPEPTQQQHPPPQVDPTDQPEPEPVRTDSVHIRLLEGLAQPGWLSSDTLDHALDTLRWQFPHVCFCPPALWLPESLHLRFFAGLECLHETFSNIILFILWHDHWIVCEITVHHWEAFVQTIGPIEIMPDLASIVAAVCVLFQIQDVVLNTATTHFRPVPGLCGWTLLWTLYQRFQVEPALSPQPLLAALRTHARHELIQRIQILDHAVFETADPELLRFASAINLDFMTRIIQNRFPTERARGGTISDSTQPQSALPVTERDPFVVSTQRVTERLALFDTQPGWLFSDTADYLLDFLRQADPDTAYLPPMQWTFDQGVSTFNDLQVPHQSFHKSIGLVLWNTHWVLCEIQSTVCAQWIFLTGPPNLRPHSIACATAICEHLGIDPVPHIVFRDFQADPNLCGWTLLWLCFQKAGVLIHYPGPVQETHFPRSIHHAEVQRVLTNAAAAWQQPILHQAALFAMRLLPWHLLQVLQGRFPNVQAPGGGGEAKTAAKAKNSQRSGTDPLLVHDPWAKAAAASSRWEDLKLEDHHPFQDSKGEQLVQYHRLQTSTTTKGVVLTTKQHLPELLKLGPKQPLIAILHNRHPSSSRDDDQLQVIAKLPSASWSGISWIKVLAQPLDTSVIPKFWEISLKGLRELSISIEGVKGAAGAILTRRGLAVRAWSSEIAEVRRKLLPMDARLNDTNIKVVPRFMVDASGWPPGASPTDVIETVAKAVSQAPIPTRTFRAAGVHTWQLGFQAMPTVLTFTVKINGALHQILLTPTPPTTKGGGKGKNRNPKKTATKEDEPFPPAVTSIAAVAAQHDKKRLDHLENKFETLQKQVCGIEHKQTNLESKLDQRFNDIGDTLRQLVQLSTNRAHEPTGETPPPKTQRTL
ncbi:unnamed protein product [Durusdinium trenchii]|uniref:Uncharacterized protein n=1 Tax=Durusdinium trenchii TaxID=1381693 RepID=A0ABP0L645_9DINO